MSAEPTATSNFEATEFLGKCTTGPLLVYIKQCINIVRARSEKCSGAKAKLH